MSTIEEAKNAQADLANQIEQQISAFEQKHEVEVDRVRVHRLELTDGRSKISHVELEVSL